MRKHRFAMLISAARTGFEPLVVNKRRGRDHHDQSRFWESAKSSYPQILAAPETEQ